MSGKLIKKLIVSGVLVFVLSLFKTPSISKKMTFLFKIIILCFFRRLNDDFPHQPDRVHVDAGLRGA